MTRALFCLGVLLYALPAAGAEKVFDFHDLKPGDVPSGFRSTVSGKGQPGEWKIVEDEFPEAFPAVSPKTLKTNRRAALAQLSRDRTDEHAPLLIFEGETFADFRLTTRFKLVDGAVEQMAGIAFRIQDENNYYYIRASGLGNSFNFFKIVDGQRSQPIGAKVQIPKGVWHEMTIECKGSEIRASLNGKELIPTLGDKSFTAGKIGFWTKSDSVSYFADTRIVYTPREILAQVLVRDAFEKYPRLEGLQIFARPQGEREPRLVASNEASEIGRRAPSEVADVMARSIPYHGKDSNNVIITLPLHDRNGEAVAALKVIMKSFPGQTEKNALARALPIAKRMEGRIQTLKDLIE